VVWLSNCINCILTSSKYYATANPYTLYFSTVHANFSQFFTSRCLLTDLDNVLFCSRRYRLATLSHLTHGSGRLFSGQIRSVKLLLALATTVNLGFRPRQGPRPSFFFFPDFYVLLKNGASSSREEGSEECPIFNSDPILKACEENRFVK
jgi:hypothetical protein